LDLVFTTVELFLENINVIRLVLIMPLLIIINLIIVLGTQCKITQKLLVRFSTYEFQNNTVLLVLGIFKNCQKPDFE